METFIGLLVIAGLFSIVIIELIKLNKESQTNVMSNVRRKEKIPLRSGTLHVFWHEGTQDQWAQFLTGVVGLETAIEQQFGPTYLAKSKAMEIDLHILAASEALPTTAPLPLDFSFVLPKFRRPQIYVKQINPTEHVGTSALLPALLEVFYRRQFNLDTIPDGPMNPLIRIAFQQISNAIVAQKGIE